MDYNRYCIQETSSGFEVYSNYDNWVAGEEPLHQAKSLEEAKTWVNQREGLQAPYYRYLVIANISFFGDPTDAFESLAEAKDYITSHPEPEDFYIKDIKTKWLYYFEEDTWWLQRNPYAALRLKSARETSPES